MATKAVFDDLALLFHSVGAERLSRLHDVVVGTGADTDAPIEQFPELGDETPPEVPPKSPSLILGAMRELMRQNRQLFLTVIRKENPVAQRHRSIPAEQQHHPAKAAGPATRAGTVEADGVMVEQGGQRPQRLPLGRTEERRRHRLSPQEFADWCERLNVIAEDLERRDEGHGNKGSGNTPDPPPEDQSHEDRNRIQREPPPEDERGHQLRLDDIDPEVSRRNEQCMPDLLEGNQPCQRQQSYQRGGSQIG